ncbi:S8 family peptidase [Neobacillus thermocopriae]|uniref:S8 family peptidase n=1 Tax=Neobacillus thermocopriae TaxID=1215031 RepID=A0A6B3TPY7_9BACI|nr:S8 family peptidase [Neobacillus thermocopriae]MED3623322.1 S8 family peptidase [Neobacillus thermocopriae]MED3715163.1 S8 family peptidase [Neobacillus thermocopriae]NEX78668.1 S8 family peptidase [Neobacillus thermocopriae]
MERKVSLIPYQVIEQVEKANEVPKGVEMIQAPKIWEKTKGRGITVAILDTGCDMFHPDLKDQIVGGRNFTDDDNGNPDVFQDYNGHGTHVAGTIAAKQNDNGVVGVAPEAKLLIIKVLNKKGTGQYEWIINGIHYAIEQKVDIISMSLGGPVDVPELHEAIQKAVQNNILVVCAAGNEGDGNDSTDEFAYPGSYNEVISVGAIDLERNSSWFTNSNNEVDVVAPGEKILSTYLDGKYATLSGTSMSTPHVSGALALIKVLANASFERDLSESELYAQLIKRTVPLGNSPKLEGNGLIYLTVTDYLSEIFNQQLNLEKVNI